LSIMGGHVCVCVCVCVCVLGVSPIHVEAGSPIPTSRRLPLLYTSAAPLHPYSQ